MNLTTNCLACAMPDVYGKAVTIEYTDTPDSSAWQELTTLIGDGHLNTVVDGNPTALLVQRFYRIRSTAP